MAHIRNTRLRNLYEEAEFDREHDEVQEIEETVRNLVEAIAESIAEKDPLFTTTVLQSGSFYEDLKVEGPNEFDFMFCLEELSKIGVCEVKEIPRRSVRDPGYVHVQVPHPFHKKRWKKYISKSEKLKPKALLEKFEVLVREALTEKLNDFHPKLDQHSFTIELRKIPVTLRLAWNGTKYRHYEISIDLVLCIEVGGWPKDSDVQTRFSRAHPGFDVINKVTKMSYHLIASCIGESGAPRPCWRLSFSKAEGVLLKHVCRNSTLMHKATVKILKVVRKKHESTLVFEEEEEDPLDSILSGAPEISYLIKWGFHSYVIKTMFLHEWFERPEDWYWTQDRLLDRINSILERIRDSIRGKDIRSFWLPEYKLFNFQARRRTRTNKAENTVSSLIKQFETVL